MVCLKEAQESIKFFLYTGMWIRNDMVLMHLIDLSLCLCVCDSDLDKRLNICFILSNKETDCGYFLIMLCCKTK